MGETAPPQAPAGSLGISVSGVGLLGGGAAAPRLHNAIVERLRARIAVCRQHHLNCEGRYERSRAESSDRERENTLQLLTLVQHGQGTRKNSKHSKSTCAAPPDYRQHQQQQQLLSEDGADIGGDRHHQTSNNLGQRNPALVALQGSLKRRLVVNVSPTNSKRSNGVMDNSFLDFKKIRANDCLSSGQNMYHGIDGVNQSVNGLLPMEQTLHRKNSNANSEANDLFNSTLKGIKKEPGENLPCGKNIDHRISHENSFRYGDDSGEQLMDPDLQELFSEFTYISVPPMSDLELQNMINITIKQDEPFNIDIDQHNQRTASTAAPLDKVIKSEYTQCLNHTRVGSPQIRPSSTGPTFSMSSSPLTSSPTTLSSQGQSQSSPCSNRLSNWQELSHAQQLKQIAANRQHTLIQQQQTNPSVSWANVPATGQSSRQYGMEKVPSPFRQQQLSPHGTSMSGASVSTNQPKTVNSYLYKNNSSAQSASLDMMKPQDSNKNSVSSSHLPEEHHHGLTKPLFHYSPEQTNQQPSSGLGPQSKPMIPFSQQQNSTASQQHEQIQQVNPLTGNQAHPRSGGFQQKMMISKMQPNQQMPGLQYPNVHQQPEQHTNTTQSPGSSTASCTSPNGYNNQQPLLNQQMVDKTNILQRQMMQQQMIARTEKCNGQDQLNRHLTRPPPDYKDQRRNTVGMQQPSQFPGGIQTVSATSDPPVTNATSGHMTPQNPTHSTTSHGPRMTSVHGSPNVYGNVPCPQQSMYNNINQVPQQTSPNHMVTSPNGNVLPRQSTTTPGNNATSFGNPAAVNPPQFRPGPNQGNNSVGQRPPNIINNTTATQKWMAPEIKRRDMGSFSNNQFSNQSVQGVMGHQHFHQRGLPLPNQVNPSLQMNQMTSASSGQSMEPLRGFNHGQSPQRSQMLTNLNQGGGTATVSTSTFNPTDQIPRAFPRSDSNNDLGSFDFISQNGGLGSSPSNDSDFIDVLLKTGHINDDWMKDINLDEIFKGHT